MHPLAKLKQYRSDLLSAEKQVTDIETSFGLEGDDQIQSDLDAYDLAFAMTFGLVGTFISTDEEIAKWLEGIHDSASGKSGDYDTLQQMLGLLLSHKGDAMDIYKPGEGFIARNGERAYVMFHRLLFGHDILAVGRGIMPHNPFSLMYEQKGLMGIAQAIRHLIADTASKQGLPLPGSSYLDCETDSGKPWNQIINWVQELSIEVSGNKQMAQDIYSHMFTIRMQDILADGLIAALNNTYFEARGITDPIRQAQIEIVDTGVAFFGQAAVGAIRQKGIPYVNTTMIPQLTKAYGRLLIASGGRTYKLGRRTDTLLSAADAQVERHNRIQNELHALPGLSSSDDGKTINA